MMRMTLRVGALHNDVIRTFEHTSAYDDQFATGRQLVQMRAAACRKMMLALEKEGFLWDSTIGPLTVEVTRYDFGERR